MVALESMSLGAEIDCMPRSPTSSAWPSALRVIVLAIAVPSALASQNLLQNGNFTSGVAGWSLETDAGFELSWDDSMGNPSPGSLRLSGTFQGVGIGVAEALSECFDAPPGTGFEISADIFAETSDGGVKCLPFLTRYSGPGCTGGRLRLGFGATVQPTETDDWLSIATLGETSAARPSFRVALFFWLLSGEEAASCTFDSVTLIEEGEEGTAPVEVPALSGRILVLFVGLLGLSAFWSLRARM